MKFTSRLYQTEADLRAMLELVKASRARTSEWRYPHVGELLFNYFMIACHLDPREHIRLWHADVGLVGFAMLGEDPSFDAHVAPEQAWRGIEDEAIAWADAFLKRLRAQDPQRWGGELVSGARQDHAERRAFLEHHGFRIGGPFSEVNMLRSLDVSIPEAALPDGFEVRSFSRLGDLEQHADIQREVWSPWSVGQVSAENYALLTRLPGYDPELDLATVAPGGVIAAQVTGWNDELNRIGDFGPVGARPAYRRQGLARAALLECLRRMKARGMQRVEVSTGVSNEPARRLYESVGFRVVNQYLQYIRPE